MKNYQWKYVRPPVLGTWRKNKKSRNLCLSFLTSEWREEDAQFLTVFLQCWKSPLLVDAFIVVEAAHSLRICQCIINTSICTISSLYVMNSLYWCCVYIYIIEKKNLQGMTIQPTTSTITHHITFKRIINVPIIKNKCTYYQE